MEAGAAAPVRARRLHELDGQREAARPFGAGGVEGAPQVGFDAVGAGEGFLEQALLGGVGGDDGHRDPADRQDAPAAADRADLAGEALDDGPADLQRLARRASTEQALERAFELDQTIAELDGHL